MEHRKEGQLSQSRDHVSVEIMLSNEALVSSIKEKMETISPSLCIYRVPENIRSVNEKAYLPEVVSIGPFHHGRECLKSMEEHKWRYLQSLLSRKANLEAKLDDCVKAIRELEQRARKCYQGSLGLSSDEFVEMMIVDGCFIIELFIKYRTKSLVHRGDPIFDKQGMLFSLRCDMLLLENQVPFFVLQRLFSVVPVPKQCGQPLPELAFRFFKIMFPGDKNVLRDKFYQHGTHLLDLVRNCCLPYPPSAPSKRNGAHRDIHCVEQLQERGVKFKKAVSNSLLEVKFVNGVLKLPPIKIHSYTEALLRNLIAFEHCSNEPLKYVSSYGFLMSRLICSPKDVQLLRQKGIVTSSNDVEVCLLFMRLCKEIDIKEFCYADLCERVNAYRGWWVTLKSKFPRTKLKYLFSVVLVIVIIATLFSVL